MSIESYTPKVSVLGSVLTRLEQVAVAEEAAIKDHLSPADAAAYDRCIEDIRKVNEQLGNQPGKKRPMLMKRLDALRWKKKMLSKKSGSNKMKPLRQQYQKEEKQKDRQEKKDRVEKVKDNPVWQKAEKDYIKYERQYNALVNKYKGRSNNKTPTPEQMKEMREVWDKMEDADKTIGREREKKYGLRDPGYNPD